MALVELLLGLIAVMTTIVLTVVGALYREVIQDLKPNVQQISQVLFGAPEDDTDDGLVSDVAELDETLSQHADDRRAEHEQVETRLDRLGNRVDTVIHTLRRHDDIEIQVTQESNREEDRK